MGDEENSNNSSLLSEDESSPSSKKSRYDSASFPNIIKDEQCSRSSLNSQPDYNGSPSVGKKKQEYDPKFSKFTAKIPKCDLPKMLFLAIDPNRCTESGSSKNSDGDDKSLNTVSRLVDIFQIALENKKIHPVIEEMKDRLLSMSKYERKTKSKNNYRSFSGNQDHLSELEEDILEFHNIFEMFKDNPSPNKLKKKYYEILDSKHIDNSKHLFIRSENQLMVNICNKLNATEVFQMYKGLCTTNKIENEHCKKYLRNNASKLDGDKIVEVEGLKEVVFFHLVLTLKKHNLLNPIHTYYLHLALETLKESNIEECKDFTHIFPLMDSLNQYPVLKSPTGLCLIFSIHKDRDGAEIDLENVSHFFKKELNYDVYEEIDPDVRKIEDIISKLSATRNKFYDSLVIFFMSHGDECYLTVDKGKIHRRRDLIDPITKVEWFQKKPKLFFIQACEKERKGPPSEEVGVLHRCPYCRCKVDKNEQGDWPVPASENWYNLYGKNIDLSSVNPKADTLVSHATMWYEPAKRSTTKGTYYINTLIDELRADQRSDGGCESINNILHRVHSKVNSIKSLDGNKWKQAPYFESSLQKDFIFPKTDYIEDE